MESRDDVKRRPIFASSSPQHCAKVKCRSAVFFWNRLELCHYYYSYYYVIILGVSMFTPAGCENQKEYGHNQNNICIEFTSLSLSQRFLLCSLAEHISSKARVLCHVVLL